jgi:hypothetical protein
MDQEIEPGDGTGTVKSGSLRKILARQSFESQIGPDEREGDEHSSHVAFDAGAIDPVSITKQRRKGRTWTAEQRAEASERAKRRAGGEPAAGTGSKKARVSVEPEITPIPTKAIDQLTTVLAAVHSVVAVALNAPELALSDEEAKAVAESAANVAQYYGPFGVGGKTGAWIGFAGVAGMVYLPRLFAIARRRGAAQEQSGE